MMQFKFITTFMFMLFLPIAVLSSVNTELDSYLNQFVSSNEPGLAAIAIQNRKVIYKKNLGLANLESKTIIHDRTIFNLASTSKQFTAYSIAILESENKLKLTDKINKYIPNLPKYANQITIEDLVYHTSGLPDYYSESEICFKENHIQFKNADIVQFLNSKNKLNFSPKTKFEYSNTGYSLLALIIQKTSGLPYGLFLKRRIFDPLRMNDSFTADYRMSYNNLLSLSYSKVNDSFKPYLNTSCENIVGDGGVFSSLSDMSKWIDNLHSGKLIKKNRLDKLIFKSGKTLEGSLIQYGFGWFLNSTENGLRWYHHGGDWQGFHHTFTYLPDLNLWVLILSNSDSFGPPMNYELSFELIRKLTK